MSDFRCASEHGIRPAPRCEEQCPSCEIWFPEESKEAEVPEPERTATLETHSGLYFDYLNPLSEQVAVTDIARSLSLSCRFAGHTYFFYSVAEHAIGVRRLVVKWGHPELALAALHHDSHEAYLGDWPTPLKVAVGDTQLSELQQAADVAIGERFGIDPALFDHPLVKKADLQMLWREAATLKLSQGTGEHWGRDEPSKRIGRAGLTAEAAEQNFLYWHGHDGGEETA